jgi:DNA-binding response OmpR family regulator
MDKQNKKVLILVVEDEEILVKTLEEKLVEGGFDVIDGTDGEQGLHLALTQHPDLILLDLLMPKVDGMAMLKKLRADPWGAHAKVIILTNVSDPNKMLEGMESMDGVPYEYLIKSDWSLEALVQRINERLTAK